MELRLVTKKELKKPVETPVGAVADVTLRRVQNFKIGISEKIEWRMMRGKALLQSGEAQSDKQGLLTLPGIKISDNPAILTITKK